MKIKILFTLSILTVLFSHSAFCQYFEFSKTLGDTSVPQGTQFIEQLAGNQYIIQGGYYLNSKNYGTLFYKTDANGNLLKSDTVKNAYIRQISGKYWYSTWKFNFAVDKKTGKYNYYSIALDSSNIRLSRTSIDSNGKNPLALYNQYYIAALDSALITYPELHVIYLPGTGFYLYGASPRAPDSSYVIWKFDTAGKMLWRQDYSDTCNGSNFNLHILKNKLLLTSYIYNKHYTGVRLVFLDTLGNFFQEKKVGQPLIPYVNQVSNCKSILMPDSSIIMSLDLQDWKLFPWPLVIKFDKKLDTVWHRFIMLPRDVNNIDVNIDMTQIVKMIPTADSNLAILWYKSFYDNNNYHQMLRQYKPDGSLIGEIAVDSVDNNALIGFNDIIATSDKGFALAGATGAPHYNSWLVKLSSKKITAVQEEIQEIGGGISIYPNPAGSEVRVRFDIPLNPSRIKSGTGSSKGELHARTAGANIRLYDTQGKVVREYSMQNDGGRELIIERQGLPPGIYMLKVQDGQGRMFIGKVEME